MQTEILLIKREYAPDEIGQPVPSETARTVWAHIASMTRDEFFKAGQFGLSPSFVIYTNSVNYEGEKIVCVDGERYAVYRVYHSEYSDEVELYCQHEEGITNG